MIGGARVAVISGYCVQMMTGGVHFTVLTVTDSSISVCMQQRAVMTFLANNWVKSADIY